MIKVATILGTRPELIKMSLVIKLLDKYTKHTLIHTGQNYDYELNQIFYKDLKIRKPDYYLNTAKKTLAETIASIISKSDKILSQLKPDALLLYGDTNSCLSVIPAKRMKIPIFHMEAGNRCYDDNVPEEINRRIVDHLSDINFVLTEHARDYLINEGIKGQNIIKTGSHMREVINFYLPKILKSKILKSLKLKKNKYFVVSAHREENVDNLSNLKKLLESLNKIIEKYNLPIIFSVHPKTKLQINKVKNFKLSPKVKLIKPLGFTDYIFLQKNSLCCLSDSGTITEETDILGFNAINLRRKHERPEGNDAAPLIMSSFDKEKILNAIHITINLNKNKKNSNKINDYQEEFVSDKILKNIVSHIDYVNKFIWFKNEKK